MSNILKLLKNEKVEWKRLGEVCEIGTGNSNTNEQIEDGKYPFYVRSKYIKRINKYEFDETAIVIPGEGAIGEVFHYIEGKYALHQRAYRIKVQDKKINTKFVYYYMISNFKEYIMKHAVLATVSSIRKTMIEKFLIPIPSLETQEKIVDILDKFTKYIAELQTELQMRTQQYEYYRDKLLSEEYITNKTKNIGGVVQRLKVADVILSLKTGLNPRKFFQLNTEDAFNYYVTIREMINGHIVFNSSTDKINDHALILCNKRSNLEKNDILFSGIGTIGEIVHINETPTNWNIKEGIYSLKPNSKIILSKFLAYMLQSEHIRKAYSKLLFGGTVKSLSMADLSNLNIIVPPLDIQEEIVNILDKFHAIVYDLQIGLPREIELRQKQYEYYREKLLSFNDKG